MIIIRMNDDVHTVGPLLLYVYNMVRNNMIIIRMNDDVHTVGPLLLYVYNMAKIAGTENMIINLYEVL